MTHPLTPREKVELKPCPFCGGEAWLNDYEAKYSDLPPKSRCPQCRSCGASLGYLTTPAKATEAWNRRTALASGSGEHAELARLADMADWMADGDPGANGSVLLSASVASEHASDLKALLAESAALRAQHAHLVEQKEGAEDALFNALSRATEAERKLAEAVGLLRDCLPWVRKITDLYGLVSAWLSKEAERV